MKESRCHHQSQTHCLGISGILNKHIVVKLSVMYGIRVHIVKVSLEKYVGGVGSAPVAIESIIINFEIIELPARGKENVDSTDDKYRRSSPTPLFGPNTLSWMLPSRIAESGYGVVIIAKDVAVNLQIGSAGHIIFKTQPMLRKRCCCGWIRCRPTYSVYTAP